MVAKIAHNLLFASVFNALGMGNRGFEDCQKIVTVWHGFGSCFSPKLPMRKCLKCRGYFAFWVILSLFS
jgi:hypothetical protein